MSNQINIPIKTIVDSSDLDNLNKKISNSSEKIKVEVDTDSQTAIDKLREVQKKAKEISAKKTLINIGVATKGLQEIEKIKSEYESLKNMVPPKFRVEMDTAAEGRIDEIREKINGLDGLSPQIKAMIDSGAIDELQAIQKATDNLDGLSPQIKPTVDDSEAISSLQNIQNQAEGISSLEQGIGGLLGTVGASQLLGKGVETATNMDKAWRSWVGSLQHSGMELEDAKKKADGFYETINNLASVGQSNDSFFKNIGGLMISQNNNVSKDMLKMTEGVVAGYEMMRGKSGDTLYEMEREMQNFLVTGETGRLTELESVGGGKWMPLLQAADTAEERMKVLYDMLNEEGYMAALNIDAPSKSMDQLKALFDAGMTEVGTTIINLIKPIADGFMWLDSITGGMSTSVLTYVAAIGLLSVGFIGLVSTLGMVGRSFTTTMSGIKGLSGILGGLGKGAGLVAHTAELTANTAALTSNTAALEANNIARATSGGAGAAAKGISQIGTVGAAAGSAAPGAAAGATGFAAISASISSMLVPLLSISAVIAIMIPIIAGLAIEVLLFVRIIGEVVKALGFDKLNLKSGIEGIKQIGLAMWELGRAFAALTLVNIVGMVYNATGGIIGTSVALAQFWIASKEIEVVLNEVAKLKIDNSSVAKIILMASTIKGISEAMGQLTGLNLSGLGVMLTGGMQAIRQNIRHMTDIGKEIQAINIPPISKEKTEMIQKLAETIQHLEKASDSVNGSLGWFGEKMTTLSDTKGVKTTLDNLSKIATHINETKIQVVNNEKAETIKNLSNVISDLQKASNAINESIGWFGEKMTTLSDTKGMETTLNNLSKIAEKIQNTPIHNITKDKIDAVRNINNIIQPLVAASKSINDNYQSIILTPGIEEPFKNAISVLYRINQHINSYGFSIAPEKTTAMNNLKPFITKVAEIGLYLSQNSGNIGSNITENEESVKNAISSLYRINQHINHLPFEIDTAKTIVINSLKSVITTINNTLSAANGVQPAAQNMGSKITTGFKAGTINLGAAGVEAVTTVINAVKNRYGTMQSAGNALGAALLTGFKAGSTIGSPMRAVVSGLDDTISHIRGLIGDFSKAGSSLGASLTQGWDDEQKAATNVMDLLRANSGSVMSIFQSNISWGGSAAGGETISAAGGSINDYSIEYPSPNYYDIHLNGLVTEQGMIDKLMNLIEKGQTQDNMRT
jgi:hypothetical protein